MDSREYSIKVGSDKSGKTVFGIVHNDSNTVVMTGLESWYEAKKMRDAMNGVTRSAVVRGAVQS